MATFFGMIHRLSLMMVRKVKSMLKSCEEEEDCEVTPFEVVCSCGVNGPLVEILSFCHVRVLSSKLILVCQSFYEASILAIKRVDQGYSDDEYKQMLDLKSGMNEKVMDLVVRSPKFDWKKTVIQASIIQTPKKLRSYFKVVDALSYCCYKGFPAPVSFILQRFQPLEKHLIISCNRGGYEIVRKIVESKKLNPALLNNYPLFCAATNSHMKTVKFLLSKEEVRKIGLSRNILVHLASYGNISVLRFLVKFFDKSIKVIKSDCLVHSIENSNTKMAEFLIKDKRCDVTFDDCVSWRIACQLGLKEVVMLLLEDGRIIQNIQARDNYGLRWICRNGDVELCEMLLKCKHINPNYPDNLPIISAIKHNQVKIVKLFLKHKKGFLRDNVKWDFSGTVLAKDPDDVLGIAACFSNLEMLGYLFKDSGIVDLSSPDFEVARYVNIAMDKGKLSVAKFFLSLDNSTKDKSHT